MKEQLKPRNVNVSKKSNEELYSMAEYIGVKVDQAEQELQVIHDELKRRLGQTVMGEMFEEVEPAC